MSTRSFLVRSARVTQGPQAAGQIRQSEGMPAEHVDVMPYER